MSYASSSTPPSPPSGRIPIDVSSSAPLPPQGDLRRFTDVQMSGVAQTILGLPLDVRHQSLALQLVPARSQPLAHLLDSSKSEETIFAVNERLNLILRLTDRPVAEVYFTDRFTLEGKLLMTVREIQQENPSAFVDSQLFEHLRVAIQTMQKAFGHRESLSLCFAAVIDAVLGSDSVEGDRRNLLESLLIGALLGLNVSFENLPENFKTRIRAINNSEKKELSLENATISEAGARLLREFDCFEKIIFKRVQFVSLDLSMLSGSAVEVDFDHCIFSRIESRVEQRSLLKFSCVGGKSGVIDCSHLQGLEEFHVDASVYINGVSHGLHYGTIEGLERGHPSLKVLSIWHVSKLGTLDLSNFPCLEACSLGFLKGFTNLVGGRDSLKELSLASIDHCKWPLDLRGFQRLEDCDLRDLDLSGLLLPSSLKKLKMEDVGPNRIVGLPHSLEEFILDDEAGGVQSIDFTGCSQLRSCQLICCSELTEIRFEGIHRFLERIDFGNVPKLCSPIDLSTFPGLVQCSLERLKSLPPLNCSGVLPLLKSLYLNNLPRTQRLNLSCFPQLESCELGAMKDLRELTAEREHTSLKNLTFMWSMPPELLKLNYSNYPNLENGGPKIWRD